MLVHLSIRDIVLIECLDLEVSTGLTILTGETGAGKSVLLDAFSLALGGRGSGDLVRQGQGQGQVAASFEVDPGHPIRQILEAHDLADDGALVLRRVQMADGRTRAFVNDQPVSVQLLRQMGSLLVEIHGQHDDRALTDVSTHRQLLDAFARLESRLGDVADLYHRWRKAGLEASEHATELEAARKEESWLRHAVEELTKLSPEAGEETALAERRTAMMQMEKIAADLREAYEGVGGPGSPAGGLASLIRRLERRGGQLPHLIAPIVGALDKALDGLEDARGKIETALREADFNPEDLARIEERLFGLRAAARKYSCAVEDLPSLAERLGEQLATLMRGEDRLLELQKIAASARAELQEAAAALSRARKKAADDLDRAVNAELAPLKLGGARFHTQMETDPEALGEQGCDRIEFWTQTNPGTKPGPMMRVASGGELSRLMLALKVVLAGRGSAPTLVFDEIDTGVGGAVAAAIGARLSQLARTVQVLAVTHAPQVAARAAHHLRISKETKGRGAVTTQVTLLNEDDRKEEIARMLAGARITDEARAAAVRLLNVSEQDEAQLS